MNLALMTDSLSRGVFAPMPTAPICGRASAAPPPPPPPTPRPRLLGLRQEVHRRLRLRVPAHIAGKVGVGVDRQHDPRISTTSASVYAIHGTDFCFGSGLPMIPCGNAGNVPTAHSAGPYGDDKSAPPVWILWGLLQNCLQVLRLVPCDVGRLAEAAVWLHIAHNHNVAVLSGANCVCAHHACRQP
jgi:hypothetical protein